MRHNRCNAVYLWKRIRAKSGGEGTFFEGGKALSEYPADMRVHRSDIEATLLGRGILCEYSLLG
jgi:hypothetical protein